MTLARRAGASLLAATAACSPSTARRGELAAVLDSLVPRDAAVTCRDPVPGSAGRPPYRQCRQDRPLVFFDLGRDGMVQTVGSIPSSCKLTTMTPQIGVHCSSSPQAVSYDDVAFYVSP